MKPPITSKSFPMLLCDSHIHPATLPLHDRPLKLSTPLLSHHNSIFYLYRLGCISKNVIQMESSVCHLFFFVWLFTPLNYFEIDPCCCRYQFFKTLLCLSSLASYRHHNLSIHHLKNTYVVYNIII